MVESLPSCYLKMLKIAVGWYEHLLCTYACLGCLWIIFVPVFLLCVQVVEFPRYFCCTSLPLLCSRMFTDCSSIM